MHSSSFVCETFAAKAHGFYVNWSHHSYQSYQTNSALILCEKHWKMRFICLETSAYLILILLSWKFHSAVYFSLWKVVKLSNCQSASVMKEIWTRFIQSLISYRLEKEQLTLKLLLSEQTKGWRQKDKHNFGCSSLGSWNIFSKLDSTDQLY